jgi:endogenous inhibitor of DNA gyrase (YacG/DUF329 family)
MNCHTGRRSALRVFMIPLDDPETDQLSLLCPVCGADVPSAGRRGPRRTYCSEACKQAAYRRRARGEPEDLPRQQPTGRRRTLVVRP